MRFGCVAGQAGDHAAGALFPVGSEQAGKRRHQVDITVVVNRAREFLDLAAALDDSQVVTQPLHQRAGNGDTAFERVTRGLRAKLVGDCGE